MQGESKQGRARARCEVARELARALGGVCLLPARTAAYLATRRQHQAAIVAALGQPAEVAPDPPLPRLPARPLRVFLSSAEPSGELHARSFVRALRSELEAAGAPAPELIGLGGEALRADGVQTLGDPVARAAMGFDGVFSALPYYLQLLTDCAAELAARPVDLFVPVDSPALHVPLAHIAKRSGARVAHFITPQYWGWAPWRVNGYRRAVDLALSILPFEPTWFAAQRVPCAHVGHPLLDRLAEVERAGAQQSSTTLLLLPGSRAGVCAKNLPFMLACAARLRVTYPELDVEIGLADSSLRKTVTRVVAEAGATSWAHPIVGELHAGLRRARAALAVSGTVLIDVLHQRLPAVVLYQLSNARQGWMYRNLLTTPWFASPNLLLGREVYPEFCFHGTGPLEEVCAALERCYKDTDARADVRAELELAAERLGPPGAAARAARQALGLLQAAPPTS